MGGKYILFIFSSIQGNKESKLSQYECNLDIFQCNNYLTHENECNPMPTKLLPNYTICNATNAIFCFFVL